MSEIVTLQLLTVPRWGTTWIFRLLFLLGLRRVVLVQPLRWLLLRDVAGSGAEGSG
jgi:hypothetical protein